MPGTDHPRRAESCETTHRPQPGLQTPVIGFDGVDSVLLDNMQRRRNVLLQHPRIGRRPIGAHLGRSPAVLQGAGEEPASGRQVPPLRYQHVNDLTALVDRPIQIDPPPGDFDVRLVCEPPISGSVPAGGVRRRSVAG